MSKPRQYVELNKTELNHKPLQRIQIRFCVYQICNIMITNKIILDKTSLRTNNKLLLSMVTLGAISDSFGYIIWPDKNGET